jgi:hypothetical protein
MVGKELDYQIQVNNETYQQTGNVHITVNELSIRHTLSSADGERYEELVGDAEFLNYENLVILSSDGNRNIYQNKLKLTIRKAGDDLKQSAILNFKQYLGEDIENAEIEGLNESINTGFSHLTYLESIYDYNKKIQCTLILADDVYDKFLEQVKSQSISIAFFEIVYFNIFRKIKSEANKEQYELLNEEKNVYIFAKDSGVELFASTFGFIETFLVYTHKNLLNERTDKVDEAVSDNNPVKYEQDILKHIKEVRQVIVYGFIAIIVLLLIN